MKSMPDWEFKMSADGAWQWRQLAAGDRRAETSSSRAFPTLLECMDDAEAHGYARSGTSDQTRKRLRGSECGRDTE
jgi:hypothetical protein